MNEKTFFLYGLMGVTALGLVVTLFVKPWIGVIGLALLFLLIVAIGVFKSEKNLAEPEREKRAVMEAEKPKQPDLYEFLTRRIVGQDRALSLVVKTLNRLQKRPVVSYLFVGKTGVGKTETAKTLGEYFKRYYGWQFLRFDMGNFTDQHSVSTLVGSPKGYIGSQEGGALTRPLMQNPNAVLLFDEIEKAHPSIFRIFLSLIDEGEIQEVSTGIRVPFRGIVIFTSNLYNQTIGELANRIEDDVLREILIRDLFTGKYSEVLKYVPEQILGNDIRNSQITQSFPPEFIGRIDKIVPFGDLTKEDLYYIVVKALEKEGYTDWRNWVFNVATFVDKYHPLVERYGIRYLIRKAIEEADNIKAGTL
jgi:ATP-dependent Clp protease ATP-binding subunit ClpA